MITFMIIICHMFHHLVSDLIYFLYCDFSQFSISCFEPCTGDKWMVPDLSTEDIFDGSYSMICKVHIDTVNNICK